MFFPPQNQASKKKESIPRKGVSFESNHMILAADIMALWDIEVRNAFIAFYEEGPYVVVCPVGNSFFTKVHKDAVQCMLKDKNLLGDKSIPLHEWVIDNELNTENRSLTYEFLEKAQTLKVYL